MRHQPMVIAFVMAVCGAAVVGMGTALGAGRFDWAPLLIGATLAAATTGIVASGMQFLPNRLYSPATVFAGVAVAFAVFVLLRAFESVGFGRVPPATIIVWAVAVIIALIVSRESGARLPPVERTSRR